MNHTDELVDRRVAAEAAEWFAIMQDSQVSARDRARFFEWLGESSRHVQEYLAVSTLWRSMDSVEAAELAADELVALARDSGSTSNVIELPGRAGAVEGRGRAHVPAGSTFDEAASRHSRWMWLRAAAIVAGVAVLLGGWFGADRWMYGARYSTGIGEQTSFTLADGSIVRLNTQSAVRVRLTDEARQVTLTAGEAMFQVAKDPQRPFRVRAGDTTVEALGTVFNVYRAKQETTVTVLEGRVRVVSEPNATGSEPETATAEEPVRVVELAPRQRVRVSKLGVIAQEREVSPDEASAWLERRLAFHVEPLGKVIEEFNRYNEQRLQVIDPELAQMEISGNFNANDPQSLVQFLVHTESVATAMGDDGALQLYRK